MEHIGVEPCPSLCGWLMLLDQDGNRRILLKGEGGGGKKISGYASGWVLGQGHRDGAKGDGKEQKIKVPSSIRYSSLKNHRVGRDVSAASEQGHLVLVEPHLVV